MSKNDGYKRVFEEFNNNVSRVQISADDVPGGTDSSILKAVFQVAASDFPDSHISFRPVLVPKSEMIGNSSWGVIFEVDSDKVPETYAKVDKLQYR